MNKKVNSTIESDVIETKSEKVARTVVDKILSVAMVICTLFLLITIMTFVDEYSSTIKYEKPYTAEKILDKMSYGRPSYIIKDVAKARAYGEEGTTDYELPYAIADYQEAAVLNYVYSYVGDDAKTAEYSKKMDEARTHMKEYATGNVLTIYADRIDKGIKEYTDKE